jgi:hypothetical protein
MGETPPDVHRHFDAPKRRRPAARPDLRSRPKFKNEIETSGTREIDTSRPVDAKGGRFENEARQVQTTQGKFPGSPQAADGRDSSRRPARRQTAVDDGPEGPHERRKIDAPPDEIRAGDRARALPRPEPHPAVGRKSCGAANPPRERDACPRIHDPQDARKLDPGVREPGREILRTTSDEPPPKMAPKPASEKGGAKVRNVQMASRQACREAEPGDGERREIDVRKTRVETQTSPCRSGGIRAGSANPRRRQGRGGRPPDGRRGGFREAKTHSRAPRVDGPAPALPEPCPGDRSGKMRPLPPPRPDKGERSGAEPSRLRRNMRRHEKTRAPRAGAEPRNVAHDRQRRETKTNRPGRVRDLRLGEDGYAGHGGTPETRVGENQGRNLETGAGSLEPIADPSRFCAERSGKRPGITEIQAREMKRARLDPVHDDPAPQDDRGFGLFPLRQPCAQRHGEPSVIRRTELQTPDIGEKTRPGILDDGEIVDDEPSEDAEESGHGGRGAGGRRGCRRRGRRGGRPARVEKNTQIACPPRVAPKDESGLVDSHGRQRPAAFEKRLPRSTQDDALNAEERPGGKARRILDPKAGRRHPRFGPKRQSETPAYDHAAAARPIERVQNETADRALRDEERHDGQRHKEERDKRGGNIRHPTGAGGEGHRSFRAKPYGALCPSPNPQDRRAGPVTEFTAFASLVTFHDPRRARNRSVCAGPTAVALADRRQGRGASAPRAK